MKMTKTFALAALVASSLLAGTALQAQDATQNATQAKPAMHGRPNIDQITKELSLTDDQKTKFKAVLDDQQTKMKALRDDTSLSREDRRTKSKGIREAAETKIKDILTPEQLEKWQKMHHHGHKASPDASSNTSN